MKSYKSKISVMLGLGVLFTTPAFAQAINSPITPVSNTVSVNNVQSPQVVNIVNGASLAGTDMQTPDSGNVYEKEVTPLLREISRKKAVLEVKKLNNEIEKVDLEILKLQKEKTSSLPENINKVNSDQNKMSMDNTPLNNTNSVVPLVSPVRSDIKVLMTYGYTDNLFAKITSGSQGGYVVKRGDILPNGQQVVSINQNYIEVKKIKSKNKFEKIFVTGPDAVSTTESTLTPTEKPLTIIDSSAGGASSTNMLPTQIFGKLSTPPMVTTTNNSASMVLPIK